MVDIEKVKNGLQCCAVGAECDHCRYSLMNNTNNGRFAGCYQLHNDALVLVEEQQAEIDRLKILVKKKNRKIKKLMEDNYLNGGR